MHLFVKQDKRLSLKVNIFHLRVHTYNSFNWNIENWGGVGGGGDVGVCGPLVYHILLYLKSIENTENCMGYHISSTHRVYWGKVSQMTFCFWSESQPVISFAFLIPMEKMLIFSPWVP